MQIKGCFDLFCFIFFKPNSSFEIKLHNVFLGPVFAAVLPNRLHICWYKNLILVYCSQWNFTGISQQHLC